VLGGWGLCGWGLCGEFDRGDGCFQWMAEKDVRGMNSVDGTVGQK